MAGHFSRRKFAIGLYTKRKGSYGSCVGVRKSAWPTVTHTVHIWALWRLKCYINSFVSLYFIDWFQNRLHWLNDHMNGVSALILRYFAEFCRFGGCLRQRSIMFEKCSPIQFLPMTYSDIHRGYWERVHQ